jgi:dihydrofolate reductase
VEEYDDVEDAVCFNSLEEMLDSFRATWVDEVLVIGGVGLLSEALKYADTVYETVVDKQYPINEKTVVFDPDLDNNSDFKLDACKLTAPWGVIRNFKRI